MTENHIPRCHIATVLEHLQGRGLHHLPGQPVSKHHHSFREEVVSNTQPEPALEGEDRDGDEKSLGVCWVARHVAEKLVGVRIPHCAVVPAPIRPWLYKSTLCNQHMAGDGARWVLRSVPTQLFYGSVILCQQNQKHFVLKSGMLLSAPRKLERKGSSKVTAGVCLLRLLASYLPAQQLAESRRPRDDVRGKDLPAVPALAAGGAHGHVEGLGGDPQGGARPHGLRADGGDGPWETEKGQSVLLLWRP